MSAAEVSALLREWKDAERDLALLRNVSIAEAELRVRRGRDAYLRAVGTPANSSTGEVVDYDTTWRTVSDWTP